MLASLFSCVLGAHGPLSLRGQHPGTAQLGDQKGGSRARGREPGVRQPQGPRVRGQGTPVGAGAACSREQTKASRVCSTDNPEALQALQTGKDVVPSDGLCPLCPERPTSPAARELDGTFQAAVSGGQTACGIRGLGFSQVP